MSCVSDKCLMLFVLTVILKVFSPTLIFAFYFISFVLLLGCKVVVSLLCEFLVGLAYLTPNRSQHLP